MQRHTSVYSAIYAVHAELYHLGVKSVYKALQGLFRLFAPFCACHPAAHFAMLYSLQGAGGHTSKRSASTDTRYQRHAGRCTGQHRPPIIIRYIRGQTMPAAAGQRLHLHRVSPAGSRCFPCPAACSLAPGQRSGRVFWHSPPGGAVQRQGRGGRRGTIGGSRRIFFRAFAR